LRISAATPILHARLSVRLLLLSAVHLHPPSLPFPAPAVGLPETHHLPSVEQPCSHCARPALLGSRDQHLHKRHNSRPPLPLGQPGAVDKRQAGG
jgi:hypothetical protein